MTSLLKENGFAPLEASPETQTACPMRKAQKKLREIEKLKNKKNKTPEEHAKLDEEDIWKAIAFPVNVNIENPKETEERKLKQREKTILKLEKQLASEKQKHEKQKKETRHIEMDLKDKCFSLMHKNSELHRANAQLKYELEKLTEKLNSFSRAQPKRATTASPESFEEKLEEEFLELSREKQSYKKAYIEMMRAYHPDKLSDKAVANAASRCINDLKENYPF